MKKIFDIKRTKMIDEAALKHTPMHFGRVFLGFFLVYIISNAISNLVSSLPYAIYSFISILNSELYGELEAALGSSNVDRAYEIMATIMSNPPFWAFLLQLFGFVFFVVASIFYCKKFEKRTVSSMGIRKRGAFVEVLLGLILGIMLVLVCELVPSLFGTIDFEYNGFNPFIILFIPAFFVFAFSEEVLVRGFFMTSLARDFNPWFSIIVSSLLYSLFSLSYLNALGFVNTLLFNILLGILVFKRGSIWLTTVLKAVWGFGCANILGTSAFGFSPMLSIFTPVYKSSNTILNGGELGFGSGVIFTLSVVLLIAVMLLFKTKKGEESAVKIEYFV